MASGSKGESRSEREQRERTRLYQARTAAFEAKAKRRRRDNIIAGVVGGLIVAGAIASQAVYYYAGPGLPAPVMTDTPSPVQTVPAPVPTEQAPTPDPSTTP